jgi:hypothetical protein
LAGKALFGPLGWLAYSLIITLRKHLLMCQLLVKSSERCVGPGKTVGRDRPGCISDKVGKGS